LAQASLGLFYPHYDRYHLLTWLLTALVATAWIREEGLFWLVRRWPGASTAIASHPVIARLGGLVDRALATNRGQAAATGSPQSGPPRL
jgi:hypothetical protein